MTPSGHKVVPIDQEEGNKSPARTTFRRQSTGLISVPLELQTDNWWTLLRYRLEVFRFVALGVAVAFPGFLLLSWAAYTWSGGSDDGGSWFAFRLTDCAKAKTQDDLKLIFWLGASAAFCVRFALALLRSRFLMVKNVWLHEVGSYFFITFIAWLVAQETIIKERSEGWTIALFAVIFFLYNTLADLSRRAAQCCSSTHEKRMKHFVQKCTQHLLLGLVLTAVSFMSALYLIASERSDGATDVFINGVGYPILITGTRIYCHKINQRALKDKKTSPESALEVAGLTSSLIEFTFSIPAFYVFLRIENWTVFIASATLAFIVELVGVLWVIRAEQVVKKATVKLGQGKALAAIMDKWKRGVTTEDGSAEASAFKTMLLTTKIAHEELCEKTSLFISITITLVTTREPSADLLSRMVALLFLEMVVDCMKEWVCHRRGIFVRGVRVNFSSALFSAVLFSCSIAAGLGVIIGIKGDCFLYV